MLKRLTMGGIPFKIKWWKKQPICPDDKKTCDAYASTWYKQAGFLCDQRKEALLSDMMHEALHIVHPTWDEKEVCFITHIVTSFLIDNKLINWKKFK